VSDPQGFLKFKRVDPPKRPAVERIRDWVDLYQDLPESELAHQGARCMDCGVPFCQSHHGCPVENVIPNWNQAVSEGKWEEALRLLHSTNNFPEFTGKLCPAPCESACVLGLEDDAVTIRNLEWSIIERGFLENRITPVMPKKSTGKKVAVVGSGPAGLAAAQQLARLGHQVRVFEKADSIGGLIRYGIPDFKMEKHLLDRRLEQMKSEGVEFSPGVEIGKDLSLESLQARFDAVALTIGAERPRDLLIPGRDLPGVHFAMDFLIAQNKSLQDASKTPISAYQKRVVILGGGDTGSDCLGTVHRQGCAEVHQLALMQEPSEDRNPNNPWPTWPLVLRSSHAHEEGGNRGWGISTVEFLGDEKGVRALKCIRVKTVNGRYEQIPGTEFEMPVDLVLLAIGFAGSQATWASNSGIKLTHRNTIEVAKDFQTSVPNVFASGDSTRGASLIVWAIAEGRKMAAAIDRHLFLNQFVKV
jgi:glutamate synthase (NADPH/NADH) small chain